MWWLLAGAIVGALFESASRKEKEAARSWEAKRSELKHTVQYQRNRINQHINNCNNHYNFHHLCNLHFESFLTGKAAYQIYKDACISLNGVYQMRIKAIKKRSKLHAKFARIQKSNRQIIKYSERVPASEQISEIKMYSSAIRELDDQYSILKEQKEDFYNTLSSLNQRTNSLKIQIKNTCGVKGRAWYNTLETKKRERGILN